MDNKKIINASRNIILAFSLINILYDNIIIRIMSIMIISVISLFIGTFIEDDEENIIQGENND